MLRLPPTASFLLRFIRERADPAREREALMDVDGDRRHVSLYGPQHRSQPVWILLHGAAVPGRHHAGVRRMARALDAAGHVVVVPEVPSWTALNVDPSQAWPAVKSTLRWIERERLASVDRVGLMGFSATLAAVDGRRSGRESLP